MLRFSKYHGLGNDFILFDGLSIPMRISAEEAVRLCDPYFGIGADGVILALPAVSSQADCQMQIINSGPRRRYVATARVP
jgi:diaminopimelate epimerase